MAELFGLKITYSSVMPVPMHRIGILRRWTGRYLARKPYSNENSCAAMGMLASFGFAWL